MAVCNGPPSWKVSQRIVLGYVWGRFSPDHLRMVTVVMYVIPRPLATYDCSIELHTLIDAVDTVGEKGN